VDAGVDVMAAGAVAAGVAAAAGVIVAGAAAAAGVVTVGFAVVLAVTVAVGIDTWTVGMDTRGGVSGTDVVLVAMPVAAVERSACRCAA